MAQLGYAILFISHDKEKTIKPQNSAEYQQIASSMQSSAYSIIENMSDIIGYAHPKVQDSGSSEMVLTLRSNDNSVRCGCRFKYIKPEIPFSYEALTEALNEAIDKEAVETNNKFVTDERLPAIELKTYDYDALMTEFQDLVGTIMQQNENNAPKIQQIVEKYLGKGKKVVNATLDQAEFIYLIVEEMKIEFNIH